MNQHTNVSYPNLSSVVMAKVATGTSDENQAETFDADLPDSNPMEIDPTETDIEALPPSFPDHDIDELLNRPSTSHSSLEHRMPTIASVLIDALKPFAEIYQKEPIPIATALLNAIQPLTTSPVEGLQPISTALVNALTEFSESIQYSMRPRSTVRYDDIESEMSFTSSLDQWQPPKRVLHELQIQRAEAKGPKLTKSLLNNIVRDCDLSKNAAKMFASRIVQLYKVFDRSIMNGVFKIIFALAKVDLIFIYAFF